MEGFSMIVFYLGILLVPGLLFSTLKQFIKANNAAGSKDATKPGKFPGPTQFPIIGRIHDLPRFGLWLKFKEWADEFGPIYQTSMLGQKFVIISDEKIAQDLLIKNGNNFAGRPQIRALINHKAGPVYSALMDRHDTWKYQRRWVHAAMASAHSEHFYGHIEEEVKRYLVTLLVDPDKFHTSTRELTGRVMSRLAWDDASQGPKNGLTAIETLTQMSVSGPIINTVTPLWHISDFFRYNPWRKFEIGREARLKAWWLTLLRDSRQRYLRGEMPPDTWTYRYFEQLVKDGNTTCEMSEKDEEMTSCMLGFQCLVGVVTLSGPMQFFLMCMALHPEWLKKCQEEIDRVCGDRMPTVADSPHLPTVRACLKETVRWRSGVPLGVPHQCENDSEFRGVQIEKGTIILACEWNINRDPKMYPDPENYHPERWLEPTWPSYQEPLTKYPNFRDGKAMHTFGWGRRTCLGQTIVDDELFAAGASVCWGFDLSKKTCPATGEPIEWDNQATNSNVILEPKPFPISIRPRSEARAETILEGYKGVHTILKV
ncbi:related to cytochrome p450 [Cephalotrichum gorgonifer]|uniref:Related to cytochrome p450 n=1 Tax=Cephalotrichum gorgonifer TaxID=2041049 RepID=A0AAE8SYM5_9PEZI|nr:related to cytochrome p450 [Cephalotrichum gorgonifer]